MDLTPRTISGHRGHMEANSRTVSRDLIDSVLQPHIEVAADLLDMVGTHSTEDPTYRFQAAALIVFLAGVDKALSSTLQLLYLAGEVSWDWLRAGRKLAPGLVECRRGLTAKLNKLSSMGLDLTELQWIVDLRNAYVHSCGIYAGYRVGLDDSEPPQLRLRVSGPELRHRLPPLVSLGSVEIRHYAGELSDRLSDYLDKTGWRDAWKSISDGLAELPVNPEPEYSRMTGGSEDEVRELVGKLNTLYIGEGLHLLIGTRHRGLDTDRSGP